MEEKIAKGISYIFHPIFLPVYCLMLLFNLDLIFTFELTLKAKLILFFFITVSTIILPLCIIYLMKRQKFIASYQMETRDERRYPYLIVAIFYFFSYNIFRQLQLPDMYALYFMGAAFLLLLVVLINIWWKISIHMIGIGGVFGTVTGISISLEANLLFLMMFISILAGIIAFARLRLNAHKPAEVYGGFLLGAFVMASILIWLG